jgi:hypothetical protein
MTDDTGLLRGGEGVVGVGNAAAQLSTLLTSSSITSFERPAALIAFDISTCLARERSVKVFALFGNRFDEGGTGGAGSAREAFTIMASQRSMNSLR